MTLRVFDTQFVAEGMENIGEIWYCLVPFLMQHCPFGILVLVSSNKVVLFFNGVPEGIPCRGHQKYCRFLYDPLLRVSIPPILNMGDDLGECQSNLFPIGNIVDRKIPFEQIHPFIYNIRIYQSLNNGISKFTCTLKGVP
jgi:hypothetical protein